MRNMSDRDKPVYCQKCGEHMERIKFPREGASYIIKAKLDASKYE
jgi:hypothetical protein